jgi:hypothetical protein
MQYYDAEAGAIVKCMVSDVREMAHDDNADGYKRHRTDLGPIVERLDENTIRVNGLEVRRNADPISRAEAGDALSRYALLELRMNPAQGMREALMKARKALALAAEAWD